MKKKRYNPPPPQIAYHPPDDLCQKLGRHLEEGLSFTSFAGILGISRVTLYGLLDKYPEFKAAREIGEMKALLSLERKRLMAIDGEPIHVGMLMFSMHTRFPHEYPRDNEAAPIDLPELAALMERMRTEL